MKESLKPEIKPATLRDITWIAANLREQDKREILASSTLVARDAAIVCLHGSPNFAWCVWINGQPHAAFGIGQGSPMTPYIRSAWAFGTDKMRRCIPAISRFTVDEWPGRLIAEGVTRVEVRSLLGHDVAGRWLKSLRAKHEGILRNYGSSGEEFDLYSWTKEDWPDA